MIYQNNKWYVKVGKNFENFEKNQQLFKGKGWTHACFSFESANMIVSRGQKGSRIPLPSIDRSVRNLAYSKLWFQMLKGNELIKNHFPKYFNQQKKRLAIDYKVEDKNPNSLMKIYQNNKFDKWIEKYNEKTSHFCNSFILFFDNDQKKYFGRIEVIHPLIGNSVSITVKLFNVNKFQNFRIFCISSYLEQRKTVPVSSILYFFSTFHFYSQVWLIPMDNRTNKIN